MASLTASPLRPSPADLARWQASFRRRRRIWALIGVAWIAVILGGALLFEGRAPDWYILLGAAIWFGAFMTGILVWKCPRCDELLGRSLFIQRCPHCFLDLDERPASERRAV
jgi:hypothetical protein